MAARSTLWPLVLAALVGGLAGSAFAAAGERAAEGWECRNDLEVRCGDGGCEVEPFAHPLVCGDDTPPPSPARSGSDRDPVLEACTAAFGPPVDPGQGLFEVDRDFVLQVEFDAGDRLQRLSVFPKHWFGDSHPEWDETEDVGELDETQYETLLRRLDGIYPRGDLVTPDEQPVVHGMTLRRRDVYQHAVVTTGEVVDDTAPPDAPRAIKYFMVSPTA